MSVVLVHGAWHGPWAWDGVMTELDRRDIPAEAVELPFTGFPDDAAAAREAIERAGPGAVVCGHSYGGFVISAAARGLPVGCLVYLCAFMVDEDEEPFPLWFSHPVPLHDAIIDLDGRSTVDTSRAQVCFYADAPDDVATTAISRLRSIPGAGGPPIDHADPAWRHARSTYVVCRRDQAIHPDVQRTMARHADQVVEWDADHSPFLSQPALVAALLGDLVSAAAAP
jgi:pimeloyl-ACP methyl ester carboxylesterase